MSTISASTTSTTAYKVTADTTGALVLQTGATPTTAVTIDTSQNVGIGTASPSSYGKFAVIGKSYSSTGYALTTDGTNFTPSGVTNSIPNYGIGAPETSVVSVSGFESLRFYTNQAERMRIDGSGNVGIGTTAITDKLTVAGNTRLVNGVLTASGPVQAGNQYYGWEMYNVDSTRNYLQSYNRFNSTWMNSIYNALSHQFWISGTEQVRIDSSGNLLVGTSSTGNQKLVVASSTAETGIQITTTSTNGRTYELISGGSGGAFAGGLFGLYDRTAGAARFAVDSSGNLLVGTTSQINSSKQSIYSGVTNATTYNTLGLTGGATLTIQQQTTSVSTSATVILTPGQYGSFMVVFGSNGTSRFQDILNCSIGTGTVNVINSLTCSGTPGTRTYTQSSSTFRLQMSAGTYTVQVAALTTNG